MAKFIENERENIINKVKSLLKLSEKAGTFEEGQNAMLKAQELMIKHQIELSHIDKLEENKQIKKVVDEEFTARKRNRWFVKQLAYVVAKNFKCESYIINFGNKNSIAFIGLKEDIDIARQIFNYALTEMEKFSNEYANNFANNNQVDRSFKSGIKNDYIKGYILGLNAKFASQVEKNNWGLILVKDKQVVQYIDNKKLKKSHSAPVNNSGDRVAYRKGFEDGNNFGFKID